MPSDTPEGEDETGKRRQHQCRAKHSRFLGQDREDEIRLIHCQIALRTQSLPHARAFQSSLVNRSETFGELGAFVGIGLFPWCEPRVEASDSIFLHPDVQTTEEPKGDDSCGQPPPIGTGGEQQHDQSAKHQSG